MATKKQCLPRDWREGRRLRALELHEQGWSGKAIAAALGVSQSAVSQWLNRVRGSVALLAWPEEAVLNRSPSRWSGTRLQLRTRRRTLPRPRFRPPSPRPSPDPPTPPPSPSGRTLGAEPSGRWPVGGSPLATLHSLPLPSR